MDKPFIAFCSMLITVIMTSLGLRGGGNDLNVVLYVTGSED